MRAVCEMVNDHESSTECGAPRAGVTEDDVVVCRPCGEGMEREGFRVDWDKPAAPAGQGSLFGGGS